MPPKTPTNIDNCTCTVNKSIPGTPPTGCCICTKAKRYHFFPTRHYPHSVFDFEMNKLQWQYLFVFVLFRTTTCAFLLHHSIPQNRRSISSWMVRSDEYYQETLPTSPTKSIRRIARVEKFARLPVWPVWMGLVIFVVSRTLGNDWAAKLEDAVGGRVCPNFFQDTSSPFIMLVHHRHSFATLDPIRWFQAKFILPEGFPSHPHRGFTTLTYFLKGGFRHRDSLGIEQDYGSTMENHSQWLFTGAGLLHEEMFSEDHAQQELYQLWINVPSQKKLDPPDVRLLGETECPRIEIAGKSQTVVLAGDYHNQKSLAPIMSDLAIFHVRIEPGEMWSYDVPSSFETIVLYIRQGSCTIDGTDIAVHNTAYCEPIGKMLQVESVKGVDFLLLAGAPMREPMAAQGSMVMNTQGQIEEAYRDYQLGFMGTPWDHQLSNDDWKRHVAKNPCRYQYTEESSSSTIR